MTKYEAVPFLAWHLELLLMDGDAESMGLPEFDLATLKYMESQNAKTLLIDNRVVLCGGTMELWPRRHQCWAYLNARTGKYMLRTTRGAKRIIDAAQGRIEATVRVDFEPGHRWMRLLGFKVETPVLARFGPDGRDHVGYVKFNQG